MSKEKEVAFQVSPLIRKGVSRLLTIANFTSITSFSSVARERRASLASTDSWIDTTSSFAFSARNFNLFNLAGFSPITGSPSTSASFDSAASTSAFASLAATSADEIFLLRDVISFLRSEIRLYVLLTAFLRTCWMKNKVAITKQNKVCMARIKNSNMLWFG